MRQHGEGGFRVIVHHDGAFLFLPLRYGGGTTIGFNIGRISLEEFKTKIEERTGNPVRCLYWLGTVDDFGTLMKLDAENDLLVFYDVAQRYGTLNVYVDHLGVDIDHHINNVASEEGGECVEQVELVPDDEDDNVQSKAQEGFSTPEIGQSSRHPVDGNIEPDGDFTESEDEDYEPSESEAESLASLDHLSEGEEELMEVRKGNPIAKIPKFNSMPKLGGENSQSGGQDRSVIHQEHDEFMVQLMNALKGDDDEAEWVDPLEPPPEPDTKFPIHDQDTHWRQKAPKIGERYEGPEQLKLCLSYYALANGYSLWYERTSKSHIVARCGVRPPKLSEPEKGRQKKTERYQPPEKTCNWRLAASWMRDERSFQVKKLTEEHTCVRNFKFGSLINYKWIGRHFADRIRQQPEIKCSLLQELVMKKYKCFVTQQQVKRARSWALNEYERSLEEHYALLRPYGDALLRTNPGSTVQLGTTTNPDGKTYFDRFYVCLFGLKEGFKKGCRRVVALDGCFLKTSCKGELLTAVGRDGNNQIYPIAWAVVNVENKDNWSWFLTLLSNDLDAPNGFSLTLMSDQHKGLLEAVKEVMPRAEHRQCAVTCILA